MPHRQRTSSDDNDPLTKAMAPPPNETPQEREARVNKEREAKRVSDEIDEELRKGVKKGPKPIKILLLGQSESGKSTTLKNFQLMNSHKAFHDERASWRAVVQYNIARSIRLIIEAMNEAQRVAYPTTPSSPSLSRHTRQDSRPPSPREDPGYPPLTAEHLKLKMRLSPLAQVEDALARKFSLAGSSPAEPCNNKDPSSSQRPREVIVNSTTQWKGIFGCHPAKESETRASMDSELMIDWDDPQDPGGLLNACADDMKRLWNDPTIQTLLDMQKLRVEEVAGFFLDALDRVTSPRYVPTDDDILRARIKTVGVTEYRFCPKMGSNLFGGSIIAEWRVFDVGGQRSMRAAWVPFFDDMDAIIFLAAISCFDQTLAEDATVNRLEDSVHLWKSIVSNPLLQNTKIVLFLNKCDIFKTKLKAGTRLANYIVSYAERPNDFETASQYLRKKFYGIQKQFSPKPRPFYAHFTSVTDTTSTKSILTNVQDTILRDNLRKSSLIV